MDSGGIEIFRSLFVKKGEIKMTIQEVCRKWDNFSWNSKIEVNFYDIRDYHRILQMRMTGQELLYDDRFKNTRQKEVASFRKSIHGIRFDVMGG